jgi:hypothetical protein
MNLSEVAQEIEQDVVDDEYGWGEDIVITSRSTNIPVPVRALPQVMRQAQYNEKTKVYDDGMAFLSVFLDFKPLKGDIITYDGEDYVVENLEGVKPYDIFCRVNARHSRGRSTRRER